MISMATFSCPSCGSRDQHFPIFKALTRVVKKNCSSCGAEIESEIGSVKYVLLLIYVHVVLILVAVPLVLGMAGEKWGVAIASAAIFVVFVLPPAIMLHARNAVVKLFPGSETSIAEKDSPA